ncbi:MAG: pyridoxamine kinase [Oscillospiraceae bacterium]|nr:pyridoxamine kinase [Oscillospiraceae bacterium]
MQGVESVYRNQQKKIAAINDFCGFGRCSLAVSLPIISAMGLQCCPLPTAVFSNHTGYDSFYYTDFTSHMEAYKKEWEKLELHFDGILTGFLGSVEQIGFVCGFLERFKTPDTVTVIDPVMGDDGGLYPTYSPALAENMTALLKYADILTPNLTEACILTGTPYQEDMDEGDLLALCEKLHSRGPGKIVISGLERGEDLENFVFEAGKAPTVIREHKTGPCRAGTGDVFASILVADAIRGRDLAESVRHASAFIAKALRRTMELKLPEPDGIAFEEFLHELGREK